MNFPQIITDLKRDEGVVLHAYQDSMSFWTIGIGRLIDQRKGGGISEKEAVMLLTHDLERITADLDTRIPWWAHQPEPVQRALVNMAFNLGVPGLMGFKGMLAALQARNYVEAAKAALDSKWAKQVGDRARRVADLIRGAH